MSSRHSEDRTAHYVLEHQFERELNLTTCCCGSDGSKTSTLIQPIGARGKSHTRQTEYWMVERIESFNAELRVEGMSIALAFNQLVSKGLAGILPFVSRYGYWIIFFMFVGFSAI